MNKQYNGNEMWENKLGKSHWLSLRIFVAIDNSLLLLLLLLLCEEIQSVVGKTLNGSCAFNSDEIN